MPSSTLVFDRHQLTGHARIFSWAWLLMQSIKTGEMLVDAIDLSDLNVARIITVRCARNMCCVYTPKLATSLPTFF
jgi:hypothetical protein